MHDRNSQALNYHPCTYGGSRTVFRGPGVPLDGPYVAVLGGSETFGRYVGEPFCDRLADMTGRRVVNLGVHNGSIDVFATDDALMPVIAGAETVVIQAMGAGNVSNRFYTVHPRRNDRFLRHSILMETLFREVDFSDFSFTRHMLTTLRETSPDRFDMVRQELGEAWVARMRLMLSRIPGRKIMLWLDNPAGSGLGTEPLFVNMEMVQRLKPMVDKLVTCDVGGDFGDDALAGMTFPETERRAALHSLSPAGHARVARGLARALGRWDGMAARGGPRLWA